MEDIIEGCGPAGVRQQSPSNYFFISLLCREAKAKIRLIELSAQSPNLPLQFLIKCSRLPYRSTATLRDTTLFKVYQKIPLFLLLFQLFIHLIPPLYSPCFPYLCFKLGQGCLGAFISKVECPYLLPVIFLSHNLSFLF